MNMIEDEALREDVRLLGDLLGLTIMQQAGDDVFNTIEQIRKLGKLAISGDNDASKKLTKLLQHLSSENLLQITKAFSQFLNFSNIAEQCHRIRRTRYGKAKGSLAEAIPRLLNQDIDPSQLKSAVEKLNIQLVLTSHPTEVKRRTIMRKYESIAKALQRLDVEQMPDDYCDELINSVQREMLSVWLTPEIRTQKPSVVDEVKWGLAIIQNSIWHAVPEFMRKFDKVCQKELDYVLPLDFMPLHLDSWLGGDRDGNPNCTPLVTRQAIFMARKIAAKLYIDAINALRDSLSFSPYLEILHEVLQRLEATKEWAEANIEHATLQTKPIYMYKEELLEPLQRCYTGLMQTKATALAEGHLTDIIRQLHCFGLHLVRTDIRQESAKHVELLSAITKDIDVGDYATWDETQRFEFLTNELQQQRPLITDNINRISDVQDTLQTFKMLAELPRENLGAYVISMASQPSDVLAVQVLQRAFGLRNFLPVVPLFETFQDLQNSALVLDKLLSCSVYRNSILGSQQIMIGYSDSAKDVGFLSAAWAQYTAQEEMIAIAKKYSIQLIFFHGRGGSVGRGGWPTHQAILAQPPGSINGCIRVTQQGEVIQQRFAMPSIAQRTFEVYTTSLLEADLSPAPEPTMHWRAVMNDLTRVAAAQYRKIVSDDTDFMQYFKSVTPKSELQFLEIGSRPSSRGNADCLSQLRAIPWVFAWTQNRLLLPSWAGVSSALQYAFANKREEQLLEMYRQWPFFHTLMDMLEMVLAKAELNVAAYYERRLGCKKSFELGEELRKEFFVTSELVLQIIDEKHLLINNDVLNRSIKLRNPYLLPLHFMQVELLYRVREGRNTQDCQLREALLTSIAGIAAGMRNTG